MASTPVSPVRIRTTSSILDTNIFPSPIRPVCGVADGIYHCFHIFVGQHDLDFDLRKKIDDVFGAAVEFGVTLLAAKTLGLRHGNTLQSDFLKGFLHFVELERLDDRFDLFHEKIYLRFPH